MSKNLLSLIHSDLKAAMRRDPAARHYLEIIFTYSGFHATLIHRICNLLWRLKLKFIARILSSIARILTSIEIHPAAKIDEGFFIDHGAGLVIGETTMIGKNVNVGAGTITCNYDGKAKYKTVIKDNAFIGSNSSLVAPLEVGKNAYIGSGSTITKKVKQDSLAVERSVQMEVKNWAKRKNKK